jgi:hypothetical protein
MTNLSKRSTVYFEPHIDQALKIRAAMTQLSVSELIDEAVRHLMNEDHEDLKSVSNRIAEEEISYEALLEDLKSNGQI